MHRCLLALCLVCSLSAQADVPETNLASWGAGALLVEAPAEHGDDWAAHLVFDDDPATGWAAPRAAAGPHVFVLELADPAQLRAVAFDTAQVDTDGSATHRVRVEVGTAAGGPWQALGDFELEDRAVAQRFEFAPVEGRYVRLSVLDNHGHAEWTELMGFAVYGQARASAARGPVTGAFATGRYGTFRLAQQGGAAAGCYEYDGGRIENGGFDGRVLRFVWTETNGTDAVQQQGGALMVFSDDGSSFQGYWWEGDAVGRPQGTWIGRRTAAEPGSCPHWSPQDNGVEKALAGEGRARLYGILFDTDSAVIRAESRPTIDALVAAARDNAGWKLAIEGHTDSTGGAAHNRDLSRRRAEAVRTALIEAGIDGERLEANGYGADQPVADNATTAGRSQNRRVEVVRRGG